VSQLRYLELLPWYTAVCFEAEGPKRLRVGLSLRLKFYNSTGPGPTTTAAEGKSTEAQSPQICDRKQFHVVPFHQILEG